MILRHAGHTVIPVSGEPELLVACAEHTFDVAVIGQHISRVEKQRVFSLIREHCPTAKILELYAPYDGKSLREADSWLDASAQVPAQLSAGEESPLNSTFNVRTCSPCFMSHEMEFADGKRMVAQSQGA